MTFLLSNSTSEVVPAWNPKQRPYLSACSAVSSKERQSGFVQGYKWLSYGNTSGSEVSTKASVASSGPFCTDMVIDSRGVSRSRVCCNCRALLPGTPEAPDTHEWFVNLMCLCAQSCLTLGDPLDCSPPGSSVHGILQARILEWVAISSSMGSPWPGDQTCVSCVAGGFFTCWAIREALT